MDYGITRNDVDGRMSIGTDIVEEDCCSLTLSSTTEDSDDISPQDSPGRKSSIVTKGKEEKEQRQKPHTSPTGVGDPLLSISDDLMNAPSLIFTPSFSSLNSSFNKNLEECIPLMPQARGGYHVLSSREGDVAIRVVTDDYGDAAAKDDHHVTDEESLDSIELELINNGKKDHRESPKTTSDEDENENSYGPTQPQQKPPSCKYSNSLKTKREVLNAATGGSCNSQTTPIDKLFTKVDQMMIYVQSPRSTRVTHDNVEGNDDENDRLNPTKLDLVFLTQDCNDSFMSELTFATADAAEEESYLYDCGCVIADHIFEGLDLLCY